MKIKLNDMIESFVFSRVYQSYLSIVRGIKNIFRWTPIIWKDRDWDHEFIERILYYKLVNTYNFFVSEDAVSNWSVKEQEESLKALRICIVILERRLNYFYVEICYDKDTLVNLEKSYALEKRDQEMLGYLLGKYMSYWWD